MALSACEGWLELGNLPEAIAEWARLSLPAQKHPIALELRWHILARKENWAEALEVGDQLIALAPESCAGWLHRAYAARRAPGGGLRQAYDALLPAATLFPAVDTVAYNLACYTTQMGQLDDGWEWFLRSLQITQDPPRIKAMALADPDLAPLAERIREVR